MGIFQDAQGQKIHVSLVRSCFISNSSKLLCLSLLHERMKKIKSKIEGARLVTTLFIDFSDTQRADNSKVSDGILQKFKLIRALIFVLFVCKNEEDPFKFESTRVVTTFPQL